MLGLMWVQTVCKGYQQMVCQVKFKMQKIKYNGFDPKLSEPGKTIFFYLILYVPSEIFQLYAQGPQHSDTSEAQTRGPSVSSQALYH